MKGAVKSLAMKHIVYRISAVVALATIAQQAGAVPPPPYDPIAHALSDGIAMDIVTGLTTEIGPRQAGTQAEARARDWSVKKLTALGFANVRIEPFDMPTWIRGEEQAEVVAPFPQKLAITALGNSGSTGAMGLVGDIVYFPTLNRLREFPEGLLKGRIAFIDHQMERTQDGSSYGAFGPARFTGPQIAAEKGAAAVIIRSIGTDSHRNPHTGNTNFKKETIPIPAGAISNPDADNLVRMLSRTPASDGLSHDPVRVRLLLTPQNIGVQKSGNVIAEIPGSDPALPMLLLACHLDSWDLGTGAIDDASGCGIVAAAALYATKKRKPKRTIRLLWAGAEEVGVWGGASYSTLHSAEPHGLAMESDFGADRVWRADFRLPATASELKERILSRLALLGIGKGNDQAGGGADIGPIIAAQKPSIVDLQQDGTRYFDLHHTSDDTLDKIDPEQLRQNVAAWTVVIDEVANYEGELKPEVAP
jgi:carboxypeptidase Q